MKTSLKLWDLALSMGRPRRHSQNLNCRESSDHCETCGRLCLGVERRPIFQFVQRWGTPWRLPAYILIGASNTKRFASGWTSKLRRVPKQVHTSPRGSQAKHVDAIVQPISIQTREMSQ